MIFSGLFTRPVVAGVLVGRTSAPYPGRWDLNTCPSVGLHARSSGQLLCSDMRAEGSSPICEQRSSAAVEKQSKGAGRCSPFRFALPHIHNRAALPHIHNRAALARIHNRAALPRIHNRAALPRIHNRAKRTGRHWWRPGRDPARPRRGPPAPLLQPLPSSNRCTVSTGPRRKRLSVRYGQA